MQPIRVVAGDFATGPRHRVNVRGPMVEVRMTEPLGLLRGKRRFRYGPSDIELIKRATRSDRRRVGLALLVTVCLLPLGPFALVGLATLLFKREWTTFWCAFKDGRSFIGELPSTQYERMTRALAAWHAGQLGAADWLPVSRRGSAARPVRSSWPPVIGTGAVAIHHPSEPLLVPGTPANDAAARALGALAPAHPVACAKATPGLAVPGAQRPDLTVRGRSLRGRTGRQRQKGRSGREARPRRRPVHPHTSLTLAPPVKSAPSRPQRMTRRLSPSPRSARARTPPRRPPAPRSWTSRRTRSPGWWRRCSRPSRPASSARRSPRRS